MFIIVSDDWHDFDLRLDHGTVLRNPIKYSSAHLLI